MPFWGKALLVTGLGIAGIMLISLLAVCGVFYWLFAPGSQVPTIGVAGPESEAVFCFENSEGDQGLSSMISKLLLEMQRAQHNIQREQMPESFRFLLDLQHRQNQKSMQSLGMYIPRDVTVTVERVPGDELRHNFVAFNPSMFTGMVKLIFKSIPSLAPVGEIKVLEHKGRQYTVMKDGSSIAFVGGTIVWATEGEYMPLALDRIDAASGSSPKLPAELREFAALDAPWDFFGMIDDSNDLLAAIAEGEPEARKMDHGLEEPPGDSGASQEPPGGALPRPTGEELPAERPDAAERPVEDGPGNGGAPGEAGAGTLQEEEKKDLLGRITGGLKDIEGVTMKKVAFGIDVESEDTIKARLIFICGSPQEAETVMERLRAIVDETINDIAGDKLKLISNIKKDGSRIIMDIKMSGIGKAIADFWTKTMQEAESRRKLKEKEEEFLWKPPAGDDEPKF
ncbi:MAG: hypothetical protein ABIJ56_20175 [Pseudomonadota bacterium]